MTSEINLIPLYQFTCLAVDRARDLARGGHKDEASTWLRFIRNAKIVNILDEYKGKFPMDLAALKTKLEKLEDEVHPSHRPDTTTEFQALKVSVDSLAFGIASMLQVGSEILEKIKNGQ